MCRRGGGDEVTQGRKLLVTERDVEFVARAAISYKN